MLVSMKTPLLTLSAEQAQHLTDLTSRGTTTVKAYRRPTALLALHQGPSYSSVGRQLGVRYATVAEWAKQFTARGLAMLQDQPRSGRPLLITGPERAALTALACCPAPDGRSPWSLRLLAGQAVEVGHGGQMAARSAQGMLKKTSGGRS